MPNKYVGTVTKEPKVSAKAIFFLLKLEDAKTVPVVGFFHRLDAKYVDTLRTLAIGAEVEFMGTKNYNSKYNREEVAIDGPVVKEMTVEEALMMPDLNLVPVEERVLPERKYKFKHPKYKEEVSFWSDGFYVWHEGQKDKKQKVTYEFLQGYNKHVTLDKQLLPDWYTLETSRRYQAELEANPRLAAILDELSVY